MPPTEISLTERCVGALVGTAVGDSIGLPLEGLSRARIRRWLGEKPLGHRMLPWGAGFTSDDTDHAGLVASAWLASGGDVARFRSKLAWGLRLWLLTLPAGIGFATLRAILKMWLFLPQTGVYSAGNGPAMRAPLLGLLARNDQELNALVEASTKLTHSDPKALDGALVVAHLARGLLERSTEPPVETLIRFRSLVRDPASIVVLKLVQTALEKSMPDDEFLAKLGCSKGVTGYTIHTLGAVLYIWFRRRGDAPTALSEIIRMGGDTDTTAAILGALLGADGGEASFPESWRQGVCEWPRSMTWLRRMGSALGAESATTPTRAPWLFWPGYLPRALVVIPVILLHALRRLLPPY